MPIFLSLLYFILIFYGMLFFSKANSYPAISSQWLNDKTVGKYFVSTKNNKIKHCTKVSGPEPLLHYKSVAQYICPSRHCSSGAWCRKFVHQMRPLFWPRSCSKSRKKASSTELTSQLNWRLATHCQDDSTGWTEKLNRVREDTSRAGGRGNGG